jgi:hypothetical protein
MTTATEYATERVTRTVRFIPAPGQCLLSINLAMVDAGDLWPLAKSLGFQPEVVQLQKGHSTEVHALLWQGAIAATPLDFEAKIDALADTLNPDAIHSARGR